MRTFLFCPLLFFTGCYHSPNIKENEIKDIDFSNALSWKKGKACDNYIFGIFKTTDNGGSSIHYAAANAGIKRVYIVEYQLMFPVIGFQHCTIVYGE